MVQKLSSFFEEALTPEAPTVNDATITMSAGTGLTGGGNFTTDQASNETITFNHEDTSTQNSLIALLGASVISDIDLDGFGHVTNLSTRDLTLSDLGYTGSTNADDYRGWDLFTDGTFRGLISSLENVNFAGGTNVTLGYSTTNNTITINSSADGGNAATLDGIDSSQFLRSDAADTSTGNLVFNGSIRVNSTLLDAGGGSGTSGQILSSTGTGVDWIDAPSGTGGTGGGALDDLSDVTITGPVSGQVLKYNGTNWVNGSDETATGGSGITTGKAIAMAMVFG